MNNQLIKRKSINKIVVVGHPLSGYQELETLLNTCGMNPAQPSRRDGFLPTEISTTLCKAHQIPPVNVLHSGSEIEQINVGPIWHGMALDLLLGNIDQELWGWADPQSVYLLDYWKGLDPQLAFVLVYDTPEQLVAQAFDEQTPLSPEALQQATHNWSVYNAALLHFYHRNPERCLLVHAQQVRESASTYLQQVRTRIGAPVLADRPNTNTDEVIAVAPRHAAAPQQDALKAYIAHALIQQQPDTMQLYEELQSVANLPLTERVAAPYTPLDAWISMAALQTHHTEQFTQAQAHTQAQEAQIQAIGQRLNGAEALAGERQQHIDRLEQVQTTARQHGQEQQQENELILLQLHQVQEELERHHLEGQQQKEKIKALQETENLASERAKEIEKLSQDKVKLFAEKDSQAKLANERASQIEQINKQLATQTQLAQAQEAQIQAIGQRLNGAEALAGERQQHIDRLEKAQTTARQHAQEQQQENELILLQLHQVQEELERHHLEGQQQKEKIKALQQIEKLANERAKDIEQLTRDKAKLATECASQFDLTQKAKAGADKALANVQAELSKAQASAKAQYDQLTQGNARLQGERDAQAKLAKERASQIEQINKQLATQTQLAQAQAAQIKKSAATLPAVNPELKQENELLLLQLHQVQEELERYYLENQQLKQKPVAPVKPAKPVHYGAADRVKRQLSYRLGATMIAQSRSFTGCLAMPSALLKQVREFKREQKAQGDARLPPIKNYADAHEAERVKQQLSYRLGVALVANARTPLGWLKMPWTLRREALVFKHSRGMQ